MAAEHLRSRPGRHIEADRITRRIPSRPQLVSWLVAVGTFVLGWIAFEAGWPLPYQAVALHLPFLVAAAMAVQAAVLRVRPRRAWLAVAAASGLSVLADVAFLADRRGVGPDTTVAALASGAGIAAELTFAAGVLLALRGRRHRLPYTLALDLMVAVAGAGTYVLLLHHLAAGGELLHGYLIQLLVGMVATLVLVQVVLAGASRDQVILLLLAAMLLRQAAGAEQVLALARDPAETHWALSPLPAWLLFTVTVAGAAWLEQRPVTSWSRPGVDAYSPGSWTVPGLCMALAVVVLVWFADGDGVRPSALVGCAAITVGLGLLRAALAGRDLERLGRLASATRTDELSGLLNRRAITEELDRATDSGGGALLVIDVDRFRDLNQYLGHASADDVLRQLGDRLRRHARPDELIGRLGADEFAVVTTSDTPGAALAVARRMRNLVDVPFQVGGDVVRLDLSVGVANWAAGQRPAVDELLSQAHEARRSARDRGTAIERWDPDRDALATRRLALADSLRRSVHRRELELYYQPKLNTTTGTVIGVEALARWQHDGEMVSPELFISMAEEGGLIADLTRALLDQALGQLAEWDRAGIELTIAVNLSPRNLLDPALPRRVTQLLTRHGIDAHRLVLEITETTLMPDRNRSVAVLERLRKLGVRLSIDDYGTGHAALTYLRDFAVDELKLDRSYVAAMLEDERTFAIVESTVSMGRRLGLVVVAEGVEEPEQVEALGRCGCEIIQGYLVSPALSAEAFTSWLLARQPMSP
ncbi:MAG: putative bifunctional diguanylate cyclase/phosphodiesterase [Acidimicrobiia bacterium]